MDTQNSVDAPNVRLRLTEREGRVLLGTILATCILVR
jgi:hypothetical protein